MKADNILVVYGAEYGRAVDNLGNTTTDLTKFVREPETFKLVLFTGGSDVDPSLYDETSPHGFCSSNRKRDIRERIIFRRALNAGIKMTGICRGCQFLNVMAGGKLIHHLDNHAIWGAHYVICSKDNRVIKVNSMHHQMVIPPPDGYIIAWCPEKRSHRYYGDKDLLVKWPGPEIEGVYFPKIQACAVQWHPELMNKHSDGFIFYNEMVRDFLNMDAKEFSNSYTGRSGKKHKINHMTK
jgi:putative glutamine amidotransferase